MTAHNMRYLLNSAALRLRQALGTAMGGPKHDHYSDFGWPEVVTYEMLRQMWDRNPLARAAVETHIEKVWEDDPEIFEAEEAHNETDLETTFKRWAEDVRFWQKLAEADRRSMVGDYSALILQVADNQEWHRPLGKVRGLQDIWDIIPAWEGELTVSEWELDQRSRRYGEPLMYTYQEKQRTEARNQPPVKSVSIHYSRVLIWSSTGDLNGRSILRPGYNALLDVEKVIGGGAEGFWKNARSSLTMAIDADSNLDKLARALGVGPDQLGDKLNEVVDDFSKGFDKALITQGITATPIQVTMPQPEEFQDGPLKLFAAGVRIPIRVLIGNITGERASTEDERSWAKRCNGLRDREKKPLIKAMLNRLEACGALPPEVDWFIEWPDLTEGTSEEKLASADKLADINSKMVGTGERVPFSANEVREAAGYEAEEEDDFDEGIDPEEGQTPNPAPGLPIAPTGAPDQGLPGAGDPPQ